ncbi:MAG: AAA family ATPase [Kofleriaceae bacterium]|nr:AAA family ATPase [Kofleriaceae bacterium]
MVGDGGKTNVVEIPTSFVGRDAERAILADDFDQATRVVTLVGPGGVGKTRLATQFAIAHAETYAAHGGGGAWLCDLAGARTAMEICAAVAAALELRLDGATSEPSVIAELGRRIAQRGRILLVLDNCEHIVREAGATITAWLAAAPRAHFLVTSRVALGIAGEQLRPLAGLAVDAASELFVERARRLRPGPSFGAEELAAIAEIVRRVDGLPLAIELAAARIRVLSPTQLRDRFALGLLARPGDASRHGSMRGAILDSVASLDPTARVCLARCATFRGGFDVDAAEAVLGAGDVLRALETLTDHSLVRSIAAETGEARFALYETIREVATELLADDAERGAVADRHARYYAELGRRHAERATAHGDLAAVAALALELDNLIAAHAHATTIADAPLALAIALALDPVLATRGHYRLRLRLLDATLALASDPPEAFAPAYLARAQAHRELGAFEAARADLARGRALAEQSGDRAALGLADLRLGELVEIGGDTHEARGLYARALDTLAHAHGPLVSVRTADAHALLGHALRREGELAAAEEHIARAVELYRIAGHREGLGAMAYEGAAIAMFRGNADLARARFQDGLVIARALGARQLEAAITSGLGVLVQELGELEAAITHHAAAAHVFRELGNKHREGSALYYLATAYLERGELVETHAVLDQAAAAIAVIGAQRYAALIDGARGAAHALGGELAAAALAFERAERAAAACQTETTLLATLAIHRLHLAPLSTEARRSEARGLATQAPADDTRLAVRVLALRDREPPSVRATWIVRADGAAFRPPGAAADVDLSRRHPLRRILAALARHRVDAPGNALGLDDLLTAGWPGERIAQTAAINRVHVALTTLRKLGLRGVLQSAERGYLLDPTVAIAVE